YEAARFSQTGAAAIRAVKIHHDLLQVRLHAIPAASLFSIPVILPFDLWHDAWKGHFLSDVLFALSGAFGQNDFDLLPLGSEKDQVLSRVRKFSKRNVQA